MIGIKKYVQGAMNLYEKGRSIEYIAIYVFEEIREDDVSPIEVLYAFYKLAICGDIPGITIDESTRLKTIINKILDGKTEIHIQSKKDYS